MGEAGLAEAVLGNEAPRTPRCLVHSPAVSLLSMPTWLRTHRGITPVVHLYDGNSGTLFWASVRPSMCDSG